eukprot:gnl/TRDRNA2_/TRDRNA2_130678_c1_seq2.p1 gnl/TRDRNA2_/TRDRNA2_130678_c1~~gnl/TRDRNA2_/TRDRNA2_130678_c1_seq2.p1  ORF type:complete len:181 (+),score=13.98 gnl/TRDRNA2_/TRDRNA2_130678_c1_seq2:137-679(+)
MPDKACVFFCGLEDAAFKERMFGFWHNVYGFNMSVMCNDVIREPLVDTVPGDSVVTDCVCAKTIDLNTVTHDEMDWSNGFTLTSSKNDSMHAIVSFFTVEFSQCQNPVCLSTGLDTHWKQTVFYLDKDLNVSCGDKIDCHIHVQRNLNNSRDLDIELTSIHRPTKSATEGIINHRLYRLR